MIRTFETGIIKGYVKLISQSIALDTRIVLIFSAK